MPIAPNMVDPVVWALYDTITENAGAATQAEYKLFNGAAGRTKAFTNVEQAQRLSDPQWFNTWSLGFGFGTEVIKADIDRFLNNYAFEFWVGQKVYFEGPLVVAPSGTGLYGATAVANEAGWANGVPHINNVVDLRLPPPLGDGIIGITILQGQQFKVVLQGSSFTLTPAASGGQGLRLRCFLFGVLSRGVQ